MTDLKPCPFCGPGNSVVECYQGQYQKWQVTCGACGVHSGISPANDMEEVIQNWNTRNEGKVSIEFSLRQENHILERMNHAKEKEIESLRVRDQNLESHGKEERRRLELMWAWMEYPVGADSESFISENPAAADWFDEDGRVK